MGNTTAAPQAAAKTAGLWCEHCGLPVTVGGFIESVAAHTATGDILGADGHVAAPTDDLRGAREATARAMLQADYPGWRIWLSDGRRWWATRRGTRAAEPLSLDADTPAELRGLLDEDARALAASR